MSTIAYETPAQYERDLRSANKEWKRGKDASMKWALGRDAMPGVKLSWTGEVVNNATEAQLAHARPQKPWTRRSTKKEHNIVKMRGNWEMPSSRVRGKVAAHEEISDTSRSITDLLPLAPSLTRRNSVSDNVLYSFDRAETGPDYPLSLDIFVKEVPRATERQVEREYEVLDQNGEVLRGRKARRNLRKATSDLAGGSADEIAEEDEGFQLV